MKKKEHLEAKLHENMRWSRLVTDYGLYNDFFYSTSRYMVKIAGTILFFFFCRLNDMKQLQNVVKSPTFCALEQWLKITQ